MNTNFKIPSIADATLNVVGLRCPQPIILTKQKISQLSNGMMLLIIASDPSFAIDCQVYSKQSGNPLLKSWQEGEQFHYVLQKAKE